MAGSSFCAVCGGHSRYTGAGEVVAEIRQYPSALCSICAAPAALQQVESFIVRRLEQFLVDRGAAVEAVRSVLEERGSVPALAARSVAEMEELEASGQLEKIVAAYARPTRIVRGKEVDVDWQ
ncbi:unnamed protein product, partial [Closterium sp. NIES-53]